MECNICRSIEEKGKYRHVNPGETLHFIIDTIKYIVNTYKLTPKINEGPAYTAKPS